MDKRADVLTSKIVQVSDSHNEDHFCSWLLCEDGSLWLYNANFRDFRQVHPPHNPSTKAADLAEALSMLRRLANGFWPTSNDASKLFQDVLKFLNQHGA
jgi:hypothetical protein